MPLSVRPYHGPHVTAVNDVINFAFSDRLLSAAGHDANVELIVELADAIDALHMDEFLVLHRQQPVNDNFSVSEAAFDRFEDELMDEPEDDWPHEEFLSMLWAGTVSENRDHLSSADESAIRQLHSDSCNAAGDAPIQTHIQQRLRDMGVEQESVEHVAAVIAHQLACCAENRAVNGANNNFFEYTFQLFQLGMWPVIWSGTWPAPGKYRVWYPAS